MFYTMHYLNFRINQFWRALKRAGIPYVIGAILLLSGILFGALESFAALEEKAYLFIYSFINVFLFLTRKDKLFLDEMPLPRIVYYLIDHALISVPYLILLLCFGKIIVLLKCIFILLTLCTVFSFLPKLMFQGSRKMAYFNWNVIPVSYFEARLFLKKYALFLIVLFALGIGFSSFAAVLPIVSLLFISLLMTVFEFFEPKELIFETSTARKFLKTKVARNSLLVHLIFIPLYLLYLIQHPSLYLVLLLVILSLQLSVMFFIYYKYSLYEPNRMKVYGGAMSSIFLGCLILPGFILINLGLSIRLYFKARKNLNFYW